MKVGIYTWGSEGDIRPFLALALGLERAGHEVALGYVAVDGRDYGPLASSLGLEARAVAVDAIARARAEGDESDEALAGKGHPMKQIETVLAHLLDPAVDAMWEDAASTLGQRTLDGRGCDTITDTASLVLALMLDLRRSDVVLTLAGAETVADSTEPLPATTTPEPARPRSSERWALEARLGAGVALGVLPSVTPMARVRVGLTLVDRVALELSASVVPAERFVRGELGVRLGLYGFGLGVCPTLLVGDGLGLEGCVGVQGGVLEAAGVGLEASRDAILPAVAASAELRGSWWLADAVALTVATEVGVPLVAHRFTATDATEERTLLEMEPLFGRLELGLCARASL